MSNYMIKNPDSFRCIRANNGYSVDDVVMVTSKELILNLANGKNIDKIFYGCFVPHLVRKSS